MNDTFIDASSEPRVEASGWLPAPRERPRDIEEILHRPATGEGDAP